MKIRFLPAPPRSARFIAYLLLVALLGQTVLQATALKVSAQDKAMPEKAMQEKAAADEVTIPDGYEFIVLTTEELSSKTNVEGDAITFKVKEDVVINGKTVIAKDAIVKGIISNAEKSGRFGKGGKLNIRVESAMTVDGQKLKLRASKSRQGDDKTGTTVALVVLFGPLGFLKKGKDAKVPAGTEVKVFADEDKKVQVTAKN
jgi:hypothetical protein